MAKWHALQFTMSQQEQSNWCWAAVASSVSAFFGNQQPPTQCTIATAMLTNPPNTLDCCSADRITCNVDWFLASPLYFVKHLRNWDVGKTAKFNTLTLEINSGLPLGVRIEYQTGGAHFIVATGYFDRQIPLFDDFLCIVSDPIYGDSFVFYKDLINGYHDGYWTDTYYTAA